jgi:hypothetical protein
LAASEVTQFVVARVFRDELPSVSISRLRALGVITVEMSLVVIDTPDGQVKVGLSLLKFPNGGSWSLFRCPACDHKGRTLWLLEGRLVCRRCCLARNVRHRCETMSRAQRAERRIPKLRAKLEGPSLRLKPHLWGTMEHRKRLTAVLRRCEFIVARHERRGLMPKDE